MKGAFFGDSRSDYVAATEYKLDFVFVNKLSEWKEGERLIMAENNLVIGDFTVTI